MVIEILGVLVIAGLIQFGIPVKAAEKAAELGDSDTAGMLFFLAFFPVLGPIVGLGYLLSHMNK